MPDILSPEFAANPYPIYKDFRDNYPLHQHPNLGYVISRYEDVEKALKQDGFSTENYGPQLEPIHGERVILQMDGREHVQKRNIVGPSFRGRDLLNRYMGLVEKNADELIDAFASGGEIDFVDAFAARLPIMVTVDMLGLPRNDIPHFQRWYRAFIDWFANFTQDPEVTARGEEAKAELEAYMMPHITARRENPTDDLLSLLANAEIDGHHLTLMQVKAYASLLLLAGGETTEKAITTLFVNLLENPASFAEVCANHDLIEAAAAESLRYSSPVQLNMRLATENASVSGGDIPAGSMVVLLIAAANRDERHFENPEKFDIHRKELDVKTAFSGAANHLAFGRGRHYCVGAPLARAELLTGTKRLLERFKDIKLLEEPQAVGIFTRAPVKVRLELTPA
ncbi:MAG: cytochrome P450 [Deinococcota bacterium]